MMGFVEECCSKVVEFGTSTAAVAAAAAAAAAAVDSRVLVQAGTVVVVGIAGIAVGACSLVGNSCGSAVEIAAAGQIPQCSKSRYPSRRPRVCT